MEQFLTYMLASGIEKFFAWIASIGGLAVAVPLLIEAAKRWDRFPVLTRNSDTINRVVAVLAAVMTSNGISYSFGGATGDLVVRGLTPMALAGVIVAMATQFGLQELVYRKLLKARL